MKFNVSFGFFLAVSVFASACAPDRDLNTYQREKAREDQQRAKGAEGVYGGALKAAEDNHDIGPVGLKITSVSVANTFNTPKPLLTGELVYLGATSVQVSFTSGSYDPDDGSFQLSTNIGSAVGSTEVRVLLINGKITNDALVGTISVVGESGESALMQLDKKPNANSPQAYFVNEGITGKPMDTFTSNYTGTATVNSKSTSVTASIGNADVTDLNRFTNLFLRKKIVKIVVRMDVPDSDAVQSLFFEQAEVDYRTGYIEASETGVNGVARATCHPKSGTDLSGPLTCSLYLSGINPARISIDLFPAAAGDIQ